MNTWREVVTSLYPDALRRTYTVPPEHFNKVPYVRDTVPGSGQSALVLRQQPSGEAPVGTVPPASLQSKPTPQYSLWTKESKPQATPCRVTGSDFTDDFAQRHILANLQALGNVGPEPMFILSQVNFGSYLDKPSYAAANAQLLRPDTLEPRYRRGDFDILLIHRRYGVLIGELKSVGWQLSGAFKTQAQAAENIVKTQAEVDNDIVNRVKRAVDQLDKSETVLKHVLSDIAPDLSVKKTLFLPYVSSARLQRVLAEQPQLEQVRDWQ